MDAINFRVPVGSIAAMIVSLLIAVGVPILLCIVIRKKYKAKISSFFIGCGTFVFFAMILEQFLHMVVLRGLGDISSAIMENIWLYALYGGLAAGIFEETGRFVVMKYMMKKSLSRENALMYGAGHGGVEAILIVGVTYVSNLILSVMINAGSMDAMFTGELGGQLLTTLTPLATTPTYHFLVGGIERLLAMTLHIALSILVYYAVSAGKTVYYIMAIAIHALTNFTVVVIASYTGILVSELVCALCVGGAVLLALRVWRKSTDK